MKRLLLLIICFISLIDFISAQMLFSEYNKLSEVHSEGHIKIDTAKSFDRIIRNSNSCMEVPRIFIETVDVDNRHITIKGYTAIESIIYKRIPIAIGIRKRNRIIKKNIICTSDSLGYFSVKIKTDSSVVLYPYIHNYCVEIYKLDDILKSK